MDLNDEGTKKKVLAVLVVLAAISLTYLVWSAFFA